MDQHLFDIAYTYVASRMQEQPDLTVMQLVAELTNQYPLTEKQAANIIGMYICDTQLAKKHKRFFGLF